MFDDIKKAVNDIRAGKMVVVVDDEDLCVFCFVTRSLLGCY